MRPPRLLSPRTNLLRTTPKPLRARPLWPRRGAHTPLLARSAHTARSTAPSPTSSAPTDDYYALLLSQPLPITATSQAPTSSPPKSSTTQQPPTTSPDQSASLAQKARVVFGSRLVGPAARAKREEDLEAARRRGEGEMVAGVWIPPRPAEPDNCCMSGCVNCVWDGYREELEAWAARRREARRKETLLLRGGAASGVVSMDDDGGGSEAFWGAGERGFGGEEGSLMEGIPVGIREFMRTEKRLHERKARVGER